MSETIMKKSNIAHIIFLNILGQNTFFFKSISPHPINCVNLFSIYHGLSREEIFRFEQFLLRFCQQSLCVP